MVSEGQKYDSSTLKNLAFAFQAPLGSILFQGIVFKKDIFDSNLTMSIIVCVIGLILLYVGRCLLTEKNKK